MPFSIHPSLILGFNESLCLVIMGVSFIITWQTMIGLILFAVMSCSSRINFAHEKMAPNAIKPATDRSKLVTNSNIIDARCKLTDTGVDLRAGCHYEVRIVSKEEEIVDGDGSSAIALKGLEGWDNPLLLPVSIFKRSPFQPYFALIGITGGKNGGRIHEFDPNRASNTLYAPPRSGRLYCYFNDWPCRYGNNHGRIKLSFTLTDTQPCTAKNYTP